MGLLMKILERIGVVVPDEPWPYGEPEKRSWRKCPLQDNRGESYVLVVDQDDPLGSKMRVHRTDAGAKNTKRKKGSAPFVAYVGYMEVRQMPGDPADTITLEDIRIEDPSDRHHGLGTEMLHMLFRLLRDHGIRHAQGFVTPKDQAAIPGLLEWYKREGFEVRSGGAGRKALIHIDLQRQGCLPTTSIH